MIIILSFFHVELHRLSEGIVADIESTLEQDRFYLNRWRAEMETLFTNATHDFPPSSELVSYKAKNVIPTTYVRNPARNTQSLLDEKIGATCDATESLGEV